MVEKDNQEQAAFREKASKAPIPEDSTGFNELGALEGLSEALEDLIVIEAKDLEQARATAAAILTTMNRLASRIGDTTKANYDGPKPTYYSEPMEHLAEALESIASLLETYASLADLEVDD